MEFSPQGGLLLGLGLLVRGRSCERTTLARARGTSRAAASAIARSTLEGRLVYVSDVTVSEEWPTP
ncbi:hypothetical protein YUYDRAFT_05042 [Streptomyces sp. ScaeMP-e48]|nr:hypothetical protein YUYDRAFT_05042 [Streptomyces sp. ScaeMP-e48]